MVTSEILVAYTQCKLKAYLLLCTDKKGVAHEYTLILEEESRKNKEKYLQNLKLKFPEAILYSPEKIKKGIPVLLEAVLIFDNLKANAVVLTKDEKHSSPRKHNYTPTIVVGTNKISKEQKLQLAFVAYILSKLQQEKPVSGVIVGSGDKASTIKLETFYNEIDIVLRNIKSWTTNPNSESPAILLNKHCFDCPFQKECDATRIK